MPEQPNKPGAEPQPGKDEQAVENQSKVTPDDYPEPAKLDEADAE